MDVSDILLYQKNFQSLKRNPSFLGHNSFGLNYEESIKRIGKMLEIEDKTHKELSNEEIHLLFFGNGEGDEVVLPCPPQDFLMLLRRATQYAESMRGKIELLRDGKTLLLFIEATILCLNHASKAFFLQLLDYSFNISFIKSENASSAFILRFNDIGFETQTVDLDTFRKLIAQINNE